jgi:magnesium chelatase family protein
MSIARIASRAQLGLQAPLVQVEVHLGSGLPVFSIVGLPATAVKESKERVRSAIANCGFEFPAGRITVNLAPADLPKEGGRFDLPIALGILFASAQLRAPLPERCEFYGELALDGGLNPVRGLLLAAAHATPAGHRMVVPTGNVDEASLAGRCGVAGAGHLLEVCRHLTGDEPFAFTLASCGAVLGDSPRVLDLADVRGQWRARRALAIAAAGGHSLVMIGPPGSGKSMLAQRLPGLLPPLAEDEALEVATLASLGPAGFARRTTRRRRTPSSAAARKRGPARSVSRTAACCSSTSCRNSSAGCSRHCANRSRAASWRWREPACARSTRRRSSWSRR